MAKGKATKATKAAKSSTQRAKPADKPKHSAAKEAPKARAAAAKPVKPEAKAVAAAVPAAVASGSSAIKKKNVKRGAPPMLPRRMVRRPEPPNLGEGGPPSPPSPPRLVAQPGSLHAPARQPEGADQLKQRLTTVMNLLNQLRGLKRTLNRQFFEAGLVLQKLSEPALFQAKGYGSFEKFVEREVERELAIGRSLAHDLVQIVRVFQRQAAEELGLERLKSALRTLWPEPGPQSASSSPGTSG